MPPVARIYADVNAKKPRDHWDYDNLVIEWGNQENYEVARKVGRGKYSEVFEGFSCVTGAKCIVKVRLSPHDADGGFCAAASDVGPSDRF